MDEPTIQAGTTGAALDRILKAILNAEKTKNNGKVCLIWRETYPFETWSDFSDLVEQQG